MTDSSGGTPPFGGFPGMSAFPQADMMGKMWEMMRLNPFAAAAMPSGGQGMGPSLSMMSDMLAPLSNIEELDKRVTDMRAIEQWLKLNLNMLQSAIQALEVQRATLATLRAFGAYAQSSVEKASAPTSPERPKATGWPMPSAKPETPKETAPEPEAKEKTEAGAAEETPFDPSRWWNLLQTQFNQLAGIAMAQAAQAAQAVTPATATPQDAEPAPSDDASASPAADPETAAAKKTPARKAAPRKKPE